jgi:type I restriction enzyme S subunit
LELISKLKQNSHGSVFNTITTDTFRKIKVIKPDIKIISSFEVAVKPIFDIIHNNTLQSQTLSALRDTLLPKLMSGELRVPEEIVNKYEGIN